jgi:two-component system, NtrC family, sensor kinase
MNADPLSAAVTGAASAPEPGLKALQKEHRILRRQLERSSAELARLENTKHTKETLLRQVILELQDSRADLEHKQRDLETALEQLQLTQTQLLESEKFAALGQLVAGVAHELNTPVGTGITVASTLADATDSFRQRLGQGPLRRSQLEEYLTTATDSTQLLLSNLQRAGSLIRTFKQVAVEQTQLEPQRFALLAYLEDVVRSLSPQLQNHPCQVSGKEVIIDSYAGAWAQIITNLVTNSLTHGYPAGEAGNLSLTVSPPQPNAADRCLTLRYSDDGCGMVPEVQARIFEPFFTTARQRGGTGLGLHIVYNLVTQTLQGKLAVETAPNQGTTVTITIPMP